MFARTWKRRPSYPGAEKVGGVAPMSYFFGQPVSFSRSSPYVFDVPLKLTVFVRVIDGRVPPLRFEELALLVLRTAALPLPPRSSSALHPATTNSAGYQLFTTRLEVYASPLATCTRSTLCLAVRRTCTREKKRL